MIDEILPYISLAAFFGGWIAFAAWARAKKNFSWTISIGGGFVSACMSIALVGTIFFGAGEEKQKSESVAQSPAESLSENAEMQTPFQVKAEQLVRFPKSSIACLTEEALQKAMEYGIKREQTKMKAMFLSPETPYGQCIMLSPEKTYKVISASYNNPETPESGLLEIVGENIQAAGSGAFVLVLSRDMVEVVR